MGQRASKGSDRSLLAPSKAKGQNQSSDQDSPVLNNVTAHAQYSNLKNTLRTAAVSHQESRKCPATTTPKSCAPYYKPCESCQVAPPGCRLHETVGLRVRLPRNDSLVKSMAQVCRGPLYKEVNYTPVNMSRKSSSSSSGGFIGDTPFRRNYSRVYYDSDREHQMSPAWSPSRQHLAPDGLYPARPITVQNTPPALSRCNGKVPAVSSSQQRAGPSDHRYKNGEVRTGLDPHQATTLVDGLSPVTPVVSKQPHLPYHTPQNGTPPFPASGPNTSTPKGVFSSTSGIDPRQRTSSSYCSLPYRGRYSSAPSRAPHDATPHPRLRSLGEGPVRPDRRSATVERCSVRRRLPYAMAENGVANTPSGHQREVVRADVIASNNMPVADTRISKVKEEGVVSGSRSQFSRNGSSRDHQFSGHKMEPVLPKGPNLAKYPFSYDCSSTKEGRLKEVRIEEQKKMSRQSLRVQKSPSTKELPKNESPPVRQWLHDLRTLTDTECLTALQGKVLSKDSGLLEALAVGSAQETIEILRDRLEMIMRDHRKCVKRLELSDWLKFSSCAADLCTGVKDLLKDFVQSSASPTPSEKLTKVESQIIDACAMLMHIINSHEESALEEEKKRLLVILALLQDSLKQLVELLILKGLAVIVERMDEGANSYCIKRAIFAMILLGQTGEPLCKLITKADGVRALLAACIENKWRHLQASALRALTVVCCVPEAVIQLEQAGGIECLSDVLCDSKADEPVRSEAAGLLAQITAPWMDSSSTALRGLRENINKLIHSLTELVQNTKCSEVLLLAAAALANLSFLDVGACDWMRKHETIKVLVSTCQQGTVASSFFIQDQVATVLANMAASSSCRSEVISEGGLILLMSLLQVHPSIKYNKAELAACERVQQKAAIAISRLCTESPAANAIAEMQGISRLVQLCKNEKERNNSDSVLVACLAALRKIANARGLDEFKQLGATELVEPKLWDSFLIYSSKQESYV